MIVVFFKTVLIFCYFLFANSQWSIGKSSFTNNPITKYAVEHSSPLPAVLQNLMTYPFSSDVKLAHYQRTRGIYIAKGPVREASDQLPQGGMTSAAENMHLVMNLIRATNSKRGLDVGTFAGFSAVAMAMAMPNDGIVVTMDITDEYWNSIGQRFANEAGVNNKLDKRLTTPAKDTMNTLIQQGGQGQYDVCYIDADKTNYDTYYEQCLTLLKPLGMIVFDNVLWGGSVLNAQNRFGDTAVIDRLNTKIASDNRVWGNLITIGDGVMLVVKRP